MGLYYQIELRKRVLNIILVLVGMFITHTTFAQYEFIENKGQWDNRVQFRAKVPAGYLYLEQNGFNWFFYDDNAFGKIVHGARHGSKEGIPNFYNYHILKVDFVNANKTSSVTSSSPSKPFYNYYLGKDTEHWATGVKGYYQLIKNNIWDGVDMKLYSSPAGLKYDFIIAPNTDITTIQLKYSGQEAMVLNDGKLFVKTSVNTLIENIPAAYQYIGKKKVSVKCNYTLKNGILGFEVKNHNKNYPLVIDPVLVFVTYSGSTADNFGFTATYDSKGNLYAGGNVTFADVNTLPNGKYPTTAGAFQQNFFGATSDNGPYKNIFPCDIAISKYDSSGQTLLYATYIGGGDNDYPHSLVVDEQDRLVMLGSTYSTDFPVLKNCYDTSKANGNGNSDIVIVKFNDNGTALLGSTYVGHNNDDGVNAGSLVYSFADDFRGDIIVDIKGNVLVATCTNSANFPTVKATQSVKKRNYDGVAFGLDSTLENLVWSTFLGGDSNDALYSIKIDDNDNIVVGGGTMSNNLDVSSNALNKTYLGGRADGYIAVFDSTLDKNLKYLTYYGSNQYDQIFFVDIDRDNLIYVAGQTEGNIPIKAATYGQPNTGQFISKLSRELDTLLLNTTIGSRVGDPDISPTAFLVDNCNNIYISGWGSNIGAGHAGSTNGLPVSTNPPALQPTTDGNDFWVAVLTPNAQSLLYATFFGGTLTDDHVDGGTSRFDKRGVIYQSVCGSCPGSRSAANFVSDMPTTTGAVYETNLSPRCSNTSFKLDFQITYAVDAKFDVTPILGCNPMTVNVTDKSFNALNYDWDFGDGTTDTMPNPNHTYTTAGKYTITLVIRNPNSCNLADSFFRTVEVLDRTTPDFDLSQEECESEKATFTNKSANSLGVLWRFSDGTTSTEENPQHTFDKSGTHNITLITNPGTLCEDSLTKSITLKDYSDSEWEFPNVFTPNDANALNDCFTFKGLLVDCDKIEIEIFNRWGELVWKTENPADCWDGTHYKNGKELPAGVYIVIANLERLKGDELNYTGSVTLIR